MVWPHETVIYEINTAIWLDALSRGARHRVTSAARDPSQSHAASGSRERGCGGG